MKLSSIPETFLEWAALKLNIAPTPILDTMVALLLAKTIMAAAEVGLFDALEGGPRTAQEIASKCATHLLPTEKLLRALYASKYLRFENERFELGPVSRRWLLKSQPRSLHSAVLHRELDLRFMQFDTYVRTGQPLGFHENLAPADWARYQQGQASHAALLIEEVIARVPMPKGATNLLDLGGSHGLYSFAFCNRYPELHALVVDLAGPSTALQSPWIVELQQDRVEFHQADMRRVALPKQAFDASLIANVFHHFEESTNRDLIHRAAKALRLGGIVIAVDAVRPAILEKSEQVESLLDLYFGAASGVGLWTIEQLRSWQKSARLELLSPVTMRLLPCCKMQVGRKSSPDRAAAWNTP